MKHLTALMMLGALTIGNTAGAVSEASYDYPEALRYVGTIEAREPYPVCSFTTRNPLNEEAFIWGPAGASLLYRDTSTGMPKSWLWETDGGEIERPTSQDGIVTYKDAGVYKFPVLTVDYADGTDSEFGPDLSVKIGGRGELCLADCRSWLETYALGVQYYDNEGGSVLGSLGGPNKLDIVGVGNFYMLGIEEGYMDQVNVYLPSKPKNYPEGSKIRIRVWMCSIGEYDIQFTYLPIEGGYVYYDDFLTEEDGAWVPVKGGAVARLDFQQPLDLYGKPFIFIDVDGWGEDPATDDFKMLMDVMPNQQMLPENAQNLLAHNSFARLKGENDYMRPVSFYGGNYGSFMICPVVRGAETPFTPFPSSSVAQLKTAAGDMKCMVSGRRAYVTAPDGTLSVVASDGTAVASATVSGGTASIDLGHLPAGLYILSHSGGMSAKVMLR